MCAYERVMRKRNVDKERKIRCKFSSSFVITSSEYRDVLAVVSLMGHGSGGECLNENSF